MGLPSLRWTSPSMFRRAAALRRSNRGSAGAPDGTRLSATRKGELDGRRRAYS